MKPSLDPGALRETKWHQYAIRFALGGLVTVGAGLIARAAGPVLGGVFLAFPAIFPATATLIAQRERKKKERCGLSGERRGRRAASLDAAATVLGAVALVCFAAAFWLGAERYPAVAVLCAAALLWLALSVALWWLRKKHLWARRHLH